MILLLTKVDVGHFFVSTHSFLLLHENQTIAIMTEQILKSFKQRLDELGMQQKELAHTLGYTEAELSKRLRKPYKLTESEVRMLRYILGKGLHEMGAVESDERAEWYFSFHDKMAETSEEFKKDNEVMKRLLQDFAKISLKLGVDINEFKDDHVWFKEKVSGHTESLAKIETTLSEILLLLKKNQN